MAKVAKQRVQSAKTSVKTKEVQAVSKTTVSLPKEVFNVTVSPTLLSQAIHVYQTNQRQGTSKAKTRGEVSYSTRKLFKQKGTGRARHGSRKAPIFVGGGVAFPPTPRDLSITLSSTLRKKALFGSLTLKAKEKKIITVVTLSKVGPKTKDVVALLHKQGLSGIRRVLVVLGGTESAFIQGSRNIPFVTTVPASELNAYHVLSHDRIVMVQGAIDVLMQHVAKN